MIPDSQTQPGTAAIRANAPGAEETCGSARGEAASTATEGLSAVGPRLLSGSIGRNEQLAVRALEPAVTLGLARDQLGRERLLAVGTHDLVRGVLCGDVRHVVHGTCRRGAGAPGRRGGNFRGSGSRRRRE